MIDYSRYSEGNRYYSGAERKKSILISGKPYLIKFQKTLVRDYALTMSRSIWEVIFSRYWEWKLRKRIWALIKMRMLL